MSRIIISLLFMTLPIVALENATGTLGYGRIQTSLQNEKENTCFQAPGAGSKYRLGNECESWIELGTFQDLTFDNGIVIHNQVRPLFTGANEGAIDFFDWGEFYSEVSNLFDNRATIWIGRRYYQRVESHISDYWPLNMSGDGMGISRLDLGPLLLSYSLMVDEMDPTVDTTEKTALLLSHDLRLVKTFQTGEATLFLNYLTLRGRKFDNTHEVDDRNGKAAGLLYKSTSIFEHWFDAKGENISGLFFGQGLAKDAGEYLPFMSRQFENDGLIDTLVTTGSAVEESRSWRLVNFNHFETTRYGIMSNFTYEERDEKALTGLKQEWLSIGLRPYWFVDTHSRILFEAGYDGVHDKVSKKQYTLMKVTTAVELATAKGVWERPVVRLFYTHAAWSENAKGMVGGEYYAGKTSGDNAGIQLEYWW